MTKKELAEKLKKELLENPTIDNAKKIMERLNNIRYENGNPLSEADKTLIVKWIEDPTYDPKTGMQMLLE